MTDGVVAAAAPSVRSQLALSVPALVVGVVSALVLFALDELAKLVQTGVWTALPRAIGADPASGWWIVGVLTVTGIAVGLVIRFVPGHGGRDSATVDLIAPPLPLRTLPSLAIVAVLALGGGVSLGPESPIIAINTGLLVFVVARLWRTVPIELVVSTTAAATLGALFGTPVGAALVFTGFVAARGSGALWDKLFLPLVAAGAGAITMSLLAHPALALSVPKYSTIAPIDLLSAAVIAVVAALLGVALAALLAPIHRAFRLIRNPVFFVAIGGLLLGLLGAIGGPLTLFKGLDQSAELVANRSHLSTGQLVLIVVVKMLALLIAAAAGFRGGRVFPSVFIGVALGVLANALVPGIPPAVAIGAAVLGVVLAVTHDGWISLFIAVAVTASVPLLAVLCIAVLPAWLVVSRAPEMIVQTPRPETSP